MEYKINILTVDEDCIRECHLLVDPKVYIIYRFHCDKLEVVKDTLSYKCKRPQKDIYYNNLARILFVA